MDEYSNHYASSNAGQYLGSAKSGDFRPSYSKMSNRKLNNSMKLAFIQAKRSTDE